MAAVTVEKEMAVDRDQFFRVLLRALEGRDYRFEGDRVRVDEGGRRFEITLVGESERRLGSLALPLVRVRLHLIGYAEDEAAAELEQFDRHFQRTGG